MRKIFLYGPPGSGKSTIGRLLAENLNVPFFDTDAEIESTAGMSIQHIITESGETVFRDLESDLIAQICNPDLSNQTKDNWGIVALGGGALLRGKNRELCESAGVIIFLDCDISLLVSRLSTDSKQRPLLAGDLRAKLSAMLDRRKDHYGSFEIRIETTFEANQMSNTSDNLLVKSPEQISWEIQKLLGRYNVRGMGNGYDVIVEPGGLDKLGSMLLERQLGGPIAIVCDEIVEHYYAGRILASIAAAGYKSKIIVIKSGENNKTLETVASLWREFLVSGLDRKSTVVALGGGVVGDLAGFAASTFMRGCRWVVVPTTLLSMVDASLGGKTGFDLPEGKNLVGAFYSPSMVLADPEVLSTLPDDELRSGLAEVVKHGIISDPELFEFCSNGFASIKKELPGIVRKAMAVKIQIIGADPFETGIRASLNLGHTVGHAVEIASHFQLRHGEAVSVGMVAEARLAEKLGLTENDTAIAEKIKTVLSAIGLPTEIPTNLSRSNIIQAMKLDKKKELSVVKFALPVRIGQVKTGVVVTDLELAI